MMLRRRRHLAISSDAGYRTYCGEESGEDVGRRQVGHLPEVPVPTADLGYWQRHRQRLAVRAYEGRR